MTEITGMLALHNLAAKFGDGLKPEFLAKLTKDDDSALNGVSRLNAPIASAGPAHQIATPEQLRDGGIPVLSDYRDPSPESDRPRTSVSK